MTSTGPIAASIPPSGLEGLNPDWSRLVTVPTTDGIGRTWHILDNFHKRSEAQEPRLTLLCVHGNPSWSYLWRGLLSAAPDDVRVLAVDQIGMGFSERPAGHGLRRLARRVQDLCELTDHLGITHKPIETAGQKIITVAHDWGGPISLGWAQLNSCLVAGIVVMNTAVHQPEGSPAPSIIRGIRGSGVLRQITVNTPAFIHGAIEMSRPRLAPGVRSGLLAPYQSRHRRRAIADFVEDIPLDPSHPSASCLDGIASGLEQFAETPSLIMWGPRDKVFSDIYLHDLERRLPHAAVHRFPNASHFVSEDADTTSVLFDWIKVEFGNDSVLTPQTVDCERQSLLAGLSEPDDDPAEHNGQRPALVEMSGSSRGVWSTKLTGTTQSNSTESNSTESNSTELSFAELRQQVEASAHGMTAAGIEAGDRVALMIPPGINLSIALYACWRAGAVAVLVDAGLGPKGMSQALASSAPKYLIGIEKALVAAKALGWPGQLISVDQLPSRRRQLLGVNNSLRNIGLAGLNSNISGSEVSDAGSIYPALPLPKPDQHAAVVFTSGSTGPSKGVCYRHSELEAQRDSLANTYAITPDDRLVAAFAPFALFGPTLGITSVVPDMDVSAPGTLTASALGDAAVATEATLIFASPAALSNVVATATGLSDQHRDAFARVRLLLSAGAPIKPSLLRSAAALFPNAEAHTPYGMTEVLPVADISLSEIDLADIDRTKDAGVIKGAAQEGAAQEGAAQESARSIQRARGVCVGTPVAGVSVTIAALDQDGRATGAANTDSGVVGEILIKARHARHSYDRLWHTDYLARHLNGFIRSGDVGELDELGRVWVSGRVSHIITTAQGPLTPVGIELAVDDLEDISLAAAVGIGPAGNQQLIVVIEANALSQSNPPPSNPSQSNLPSSGPKRNKVPWSRIKIRRTPVVATLATHDAVRQVVRSICDCDVAAVLCIDKIPVDRRHNSKIDRTAIAAWAEKILAGG